MNISVFTDLRFTSHARPTGVGKHIFQMVSGLSQIPGHELSALAMRDQASHYRSGSLSFLPARPLPLSWKLAEAAWTLTGHPLADRWCGNPDWIYCPKNDFIPVRKSRVAVTIHGAHGLDPQFRQPSGMSARLNQTRSRLSYRRILRQADLVLTVSEFLKRQMMDWFEVPEDKFCVVGNGVEPEFFAAAEQPVGGSGQPLDRPYVLCVGGLNELDGGDRILRVASVLRQKTPDLRILVAGGDHEPAMLAAAGGGKRGESGKWKAESRKSGSEQNVELLGYIGVAQLALLMRDAVALFYPTRYETFGIAAAEAMAAGTPVVTCRSTAVPEIVGEAALFAAADNPDEMAEIILTLFNNRIMRAAYSQLGRERAKKYTWEACIKRLAAALAE
jgi:glycosyltransferase involved in cell wall biosynthesis